MAEIWSATVKPDGIHHQRQKIGLHQGRELLDWHKHRPDDFYHGGMTLYDDHGHVDRHVGNYRGKPPPVEHARNQHGGYEEVHKWVEPHSQEKTTRTKTGPHT